MWNHLYIYLLIFYKIGFTECAYPQMGEEVQAGSVLLPASRRGRHLANIVRRQAVDGTGIKFNKDADQINAEAKRKMDVLSEELLPYIIAEQERRTTLYKRVMTAIQNGEKGVTIAEIRNKPPAIIRRGLMYRCPTNRPPREPDGSGVIMCEEDVDPTPIIFESCLSAEDKELYFTGNKYFFCNRHKVEGPDLPREGTKVIGCAPSERTPLNYTTQKCALEDTDDVVVHYRYYPDRTYKFVSELDLQREVCEHWNPCQIGYIFSLPGPDQATPASELFHSDDEIVPLDSIEETVVQPEEIEEVDKEYTSSPRFLSIPEGHEYHGSGKIFRNGTEKRITIIGRAKPYVPHLNVNYKILGKYLKIWINFKPLNEEDCLVYYVRFGFKNSTKKEKGIGRRPWFPFLNITRKQAKLTPVKLYTMLGQQIKPITVRYPCENDCALNGIMLRAIDGSTRVLERSMYSLRDTQNNYTEIDFQFGTAKIRDYGDYFLIIPNADGADRIKAVSILVISIIPLNEAATWDPLVDLASSYKCTNCELVDVLCRGESVLADGRATHLPGAKKVKLNLGSSFVDTNACVYVGIFKVEKEYYRKILAVIEKVELAGAKPGKVKPPMELEHLERIIKFKCIDTNCQLNNVTVNGYPLDISMRRLAGFQFHTSAYYLPRARSVTIGITAYNSLYEGVYQGVFTVGSDQVTKNLMELGLMN